MASTDPRQQHLFPVPRDHIEKLVKIYGNAKSVLILAEEFDMTGNDFIQPVMELRNAHDHLMRIQTMLLDQGAINEEYISCSFDKAIGHEYRAFFDAADWLSLCIRDRITKMLTPFPSDCITTVILDYYNVISPRIIEITTEIARLREKKDVSKGNNILEEVEKYRRAIEELMGYYKRVQCSIPALVELKNKNKSSAFWKWFLPAVGGGVVTIIIAWVLIKLGIKS